MLFWMGVLFRDGPPIVEARTGFPILDSRLKMSGMTEGGGGNDRGGGREWPWGRMRMMLGSEMGLRLWIAYWVPDYWIPD